MLNLYLLKIARYQFSAAQKTQVFVQYSLKDQLNEKAQVFKFVDIIKSTDIDVIDSKISQFNSDLAFSYNKEWMERQSQPLKNFYPFIKQEILTGDYQPLNNAAYYMFQKEGKLIRPLLNMMINRFTKNQDGNSQIPQFNNQDQQQTWAAVIEILHVSSLIHDDILDESQFRRGIKTLHTVLGKKHATFTGNYMIGRAGRKISQFEDIGMFKIYSNIMENLADGEYLQALKYKEFTNFEKTIQNYLFKTYFKTASLIAHSLIGVCKINNVEQIKTLDMFRVGLHLGIAFQIIDDVLDYTSSQSELGKSNLSDLKSGVITGPVLLQFYSFTKDSKNYNLFSKVMHKQNNSIEEINQVNQIVLKGSGIKRSQYLAILHAEEALNILHQYQNNNGEEEIYNDIRSAIYYILSRNK